MRSIAAFRPTASHESHDAATSYAATTPGVSRTFTVALPSQWQTISECLDPRRLLTAAT